MDILNGKSLGELVAEGFEEFAKEVKTKKHAVPTKFTCHKVALNLQPTEYSPELVKKTRTVLGASQVVFAQFIGVSPQAVRAWEQGRNTPRDSACRLMDEIRHEPAYWQRRIRELIVKKTKSLTH
jgi:putative transcriptional regulator